MKEYRPIFLVLIMLFLAAGTASAKDATVPTEQLAPLIATALENNPDLKASAARWQMFVSKIPQASAFEDPMVSLKLDSLLVTDPLSTSRDAMSAKVVGVSQQIPFRGKRGIREEVARHEAESYRWTTEERKVQLIRLVKQGYYQIYFIDKALEVVEKNIKLLTDFAIIAETRYSVRQGVQQDIFKANLEKSKLLDLQITLQQQRRSAQANLNYLLSRPADVQVGKIPEFDLPNPSLSAESLEKLAYEKRPELKALLSQVGKGEASYRLAKKDYYPDFNVFFEYKQRDRTSMDAGNDMYSLGVSFNLPIKNARRQAKLAEASSETVMAQEELNAAKNGIRSSINDLLAQIERRHKLVDLYKKAIIPQASQSLESAVISYRVNKVDFLTVLDGRLNLFNYEKDLYESQADYMMKLAELEAVVGTDAINQQ